MRSFFVRLRRFLGGAKIARTIYRRLPSAKRCKECLVPFVGLFSVPFRFVQIRPSRKNPNLCTL
jgi:adenylate cyclase